MLPFVLLLQWTCFFLLYAKARPLLHAFYLPFLNGGSPFKISLHFEIRALSLDTKILVVK